MKHTEFLKPYIAEIEAMATDIENTILTSMQNDNFDTYDKVLDDNLSRDKLVANLRKGLSMASDMGEVLAMCAYVFATASVINSFTDKPVELMPVNK